MSSYQTAYWWQQTWESLNNQITYQYGPRIQYLEAVAHRDESTKGKWPRDLNYYARNSLKDMAEVQRYQDIMSEKFSEANLQDMDPAEIIYRLSKLSYDAVQEAQPYKKHRLGFRSPYKDG